MTDNERTVTVGHVAGVPTPTDEAAGSLRALRLPHMRSAAPGLSATARKGVTPPTN